MSGPNILVACEFSGQVRDAFIRYGYDAISCDLLPTETPGPHIVGDVLKLLQEPWDLIIAHPPCTYLCNSGVCHLYVGGKKGNGLDYDRWFKMQEGAEFYKNIMWANSPLIAIENPIMHRYAKEWIGALPDFSVQPWMFGDPYTKRTCFWTKGLPPLTPIYATKEDFFRDTAFTKIEAAVHNVSPGPDRWKKRSVTYPGIADAIAKYWGELI